MCRKGNSNELLGAGPQIGAALWKTEWLFLTKLKNGTATQSSNPTSGCLSKENKNTNLKRYIHPYVHCCLIHSSQDMEAT